MQCWLWGWLIIVFRCYVYSGILRIQKILFCSGTSKHSLKAFCHGPWWGIETSQWIQTVYDWKVPSYELGNSALIGSNTKLHLMFLRNQLPGHLTGWLIHFECFCANWQQQTDNQEVGLRFISACLSTQGHTFIYMVLFQPLHAFCHPVCLDS